MKKHLDSIRTAYDEFYNHLLKQGRLPVKDTGIGFWGPALTDELCELFQIIEMKNKRFLDLGSGDGKAVIIASLFTRATGIEIDPWLIDVSKHMRSRLSHLPDVSRAEFIRDDFLKRGLGDYDLIFCNPDTPLFRGLETKLLSELRGKLILYGFVYEPRFLNKEEEIKIGGTRVSVFTNLKSATQDS
ncbi:MAG: hypothetical protein ABH879_10350 [archaeon]